MKFVQLIFKNAWRSKLRTLLTILSTTVALFLFCMLRTIVTSLDATTEVADESRLVVRRSTSLTFPLPLAYAERLRGIAGVTGVTWANWFGGTYPADERGWFSRFAVDHETYFEMYPEFILAPEELAAFKRERTACLVGEKLATKYGWKVGQDVTLEGDIYPGTWTFTIRGIFKPRTPDVDTSVLYFQWKLLDEKMESPGLVGIYIIKLADSGAAPAMAQKIDAAFVNSAAETRTETEKAFQAGFVQMYGNIRGAIRIISTFVLAGFLLVAINTMLMAARERTREIAVLKTLGFPDGLILKLVLAESTFIAVLGGLLGCVGAWALFKVVPTFGGGLFGNFQVQPSTVWIGIAIATGMGIVSGLLPAFAAARLRVVDALRAT
jgi:putative ABC transport system permease protein